MCSCWAPLLAHPARGKGPRARGRRARRAPTIPFWNGEAPGRTAELSPKSRGCAKTSGRASAEWLLRECGLDRLGAEQAIAYVQSGARALGALPTAAHVVAERFFDEGGGMQFVLHAPFGARINRAWGLALRKRFCRTFNFELQAAATDNGIVLSLGEQHSFPLEIVFEFLRPETVEDVLTQALLDAPMFTARWRWNASRALAILRFSHGGACPRPSSACAPTICWPPLSRPGRLRRKSHRAAAHSRSSAGEGNHRNCLHEAMDLNGLRACWKASARRDPHRPPSTPRSHAVLARDPQRQSLRVSGRCAARGAPRARRAVAPHLRTDFVEGAGALDPDAIAQVAAEAWPLVRDPDELHEALLTLDHRPPVPEWEPFFAPLVESGRAATLQVAQLQPATDFWTPAERADRARRPPRIATSRPPIVALSRAAVPKPKKPAPPKSCAAGSNPADRIALPNWPRAWPCRARWSIPRWRNLKPKARSCAAASRPAPPAPRAEWCHRRLLARIHRLTIGRLRREIEPVTTADFVRFLHRWQHVAPGTQLHGADGVLHVIKQLQGYEISAAAHGKPKSCPAAWRTTAPSISTSFVSRAK
jgi:ATP-dependent Lhr-like helicase